MRVENKYVIVDIDGLNDNHSAVVEVQRTGNHLSMSKDELYELWASLSMIFGD